MLIAHCSAPEASHIHTHDVDGQLGVCEGFWAFCVGMWSEFEHGVRDLEFHLVVKFHSG